MSLKEFLQNPYMRAEGFFSFLFTVSNIEADIYNTKAMSEASEDISNKDFVVTKAIRYAD